MPPLLLVSLPSHPAVIEPGMEEGESFVFKLAGEQSPGEIPGNIIMTLRVNTRGERFQRRGNHLVTEMHITLQEALVGFRRSLEHLDGHEVVISTSGVTAPFSRIRIRGEGMPIR